MTEMLSRTDNFRKTMLASPSPAILLLAPYSNLHLPGSDFGHIINVSNSCAFAIGHQSDLQRDSTFGIWLKLDPQYGKAYVT